MQGKMNVIPRKSGPPLLVSNTIDENYNRRTRMFSAKRYIQYSVGTRLVSLSITEDGFPGRVNAVRLDISEENGKNKRSCAILNQQVITDERYGVSCRIMNTKFAGSYESLRQDNCVPPWPDTTFLCYVCRQTGSAGCFTVEKKKDLNEIVESVKTTYAFVVDDDLVFDVKVNITSDKRSSLSVEVEGPEKRRFNSAKALISSIRGMMKSKMEANELSLSENAINYRLCACKTDSDPESDFEADSDSESDSYCDSDYE